MQTKTRSARALLGFLLLLALTASTSGCARKAKPTTAADLPPAADPGPSAPVAESGPSELPPAAAAPEDPWSGDLDEINAYAAAQGFLGDVYFGFDEATLLAEARASLAASARMLREHPELRLAIEGHCDERGTTEYNLALGDRRAQAAKSYLVSLGIADSRVESLSYGEERPACREAEESCWKQNRRAHPHIAGRLAP